MTVVDVGGRIIAEIAAREGAVIPLRLVEHRDMWPRCSCPRLASSASEPYRGISDKTLWLEAEAPFGPLDLRLCHARLGPANGARCFNINDEPAFTSMR
jgi:hypothetical protein